MPTSEHGATRSEADGHSPEWAVITPDARLNPLLHVIGEVIAAAEQAAREVAGVEDRLATSDGYVLTRGIKGLKSARLLVSAGHWEHATAVARQLFELLVNMEHLGSFSDREEAQKLHSGFGLLQFFLAESRRIEFEKRQGRPEGTQWELSVRSMLDSHFTEFKLSPRADGSTRWRSSWSGKTTRALAEASPDSMRLPQYELLFSAWSEQAHATPGVFAGDLFIRYEDEIISEALAQIEGVPPHTFPLIAGAGRREAETLSMSIVLFVQLWRQLPNMAQPNPELSSSWIERVKSITGGKGLPLE